MLLEGMMDLIIIIINVIIIIMYTGWSYTEGRIVPRQHELKIFHKLSFIPGLNIVKQANCAQSDSGCISTCC